ncbi:MAG: hypothetical protein M3511_08615 [Deinococcota bacterium]|nr:hypothetical protein [Deinococcota bacterium]
MTMTTTQVSLGQYVASLKAPRDQLSDREAFIARSQSKYDAPSVAGLPMVGLGGSCGKPAFLLPNVVRFDLEIVEKLEAVAERFGMFVEYGAYPHLKEPGDKEIAAVQDWTNATLVFMRPSYTRKDELLSAISEALAD